jgi:16S rRNA (uracil1498-N3)-methyltransferase
MECFIVSPDDVHDSTLTLRGDEAHHAVRSMRLRIGEELMATDLDGTCYHTVLDGIEEDKKEVTAECRVLEILPEYNEPNRRVILAQAILQQPSRFEEIIEKATELGVTDFIPLITERTEKTEINRDRLERILREATKQVSRARMPKLHEPQELILAIRELEGNASRVLLLHEATSVERRYCDLLERAGEILMICIGPEGGFTEDEVAVAESQGVLVASLGERRLRAETAAVAAVSVAMLTA